jgi:hypothetical protein
MSPYILFFFVVESAARGNGGRGDTVLLLFV